MNTGFPLLRHLTFSQVVRAIKDVSKRTVEEPHLTENLEIAARALAASKERNELMHSVWGGMKGSMTRLRVHDWTSTETDLDQVLATETEINDIMSAILRLVVSRSLGEAFWRSFDCVPAIGVCRDLVFDLPAQQFENRLAARLSDNVPERQLDQRQTRVHNLARLSEVQQSHAPVKCLDIERVVSYEMTLCIFQILDDRMGLSEDAGLTHTDDPFVRLDNAIS